MKKIGLLGGMSWESTVTYYQIINNVIKEKLGALHSAQIILYSVDFADIEQCQAEGNWEKSAEILGFAAEKLEAAGADFIVICTNTMHKVEPQIKRRIHLPILHIAQATAGELIKNNISKAALLGTKYTMTETFYIEKLEQAGIQILVPGEKDRERINQVIYGELCFGNISSKSKQDYIDIIDKLSAEGAEGVILGCTEIGLLIGQRDITLPVFDTTLIHASQAALYAIS